jgi:hypothetical protein
VAISGSEGKSENSGAEILPDDFDAEADAAPEDL